MLNNPYFGKISTGSNYTMMIKSDRSLWGWGSNQYGQLGAGDIDSICIPTQIGNSKDWKFVSCGDNNTLAIKTDGTLWGCGGNNYGQLGLGDTTTRKTFVQIGTDNDWKYVNSGYSSSIAIKNDGSMWICGMNFESNPILPNNIGQVINVFTRVGADNDWKYAITGGGKRIALKTNNTIWVWGNNDNNELGDNIPIGKISVPTQIDSNTNWIGFSGKNSGILLLNNLGDLYVCGYNSFGCLGYGSKDATITKLTKIASSVSYIDSGLSTTIIKKDGTLWGCGFNSYGQLGLDNGGEDVLTLSKSSGPNNNNFIFCNTYYTNTIAIKSDGTIYVCGLGNTSGLNSNNNIPNLTLLEIPETPINYKQIEGIFTINNAPITLNISLLPDTYTLTINPTPSDALVEVYYNGAWNVGTTHSLPNGEYQYRVSKNGYSTQEATVTISNENKTINVSLSQNIYTLTINPTPSDALVEVYYNGTWNTGKIHSVTNGTYQYRVSKDGYSTIEDTIKIENSDKTIDIELEQISYLTTFNISEYTKSFDRIRIVNKTNNSELYVDSSNNWKIELVKDRMYCYYVEKRKTDQYGTYYYTIDYGPDFVADGSEILVKLHNVKLIIPKTLLFTRISYSSSNNINYENINHPYSNEYYESQVLHNAKVTVSVWLNNKQLKRIENIITDNTILNAGNDIYSLNIIPSVAGCQIKLGKIDTWSYQYTIEKWIDVNPNTPINIETGCDYRYVISKDGYKSNCGIIKNITENTTLENINMIQLEQFKDIALLNSYNYESGAAIKTDGSLVCWDENGPVSVPSGNNYVKVVAGTGTFLALTSTGEIVGWRKDGNSSILLNNIPTGSGYKDISISKRYKGSEEVAGAIKSDGSIVLWTNSNSSPTYEPLKILLDNKPTTTGFSSIDLGDATYAVALTSTGKVVGWGYDSEEVISNLPTDTGYKKAIIGCKGIYLLSSTGKIVAIRSKNLLDPTPIGEIPTATGFKDIAGCGNFVCGINSSNKLQLFDFYDTTQQYKYTDMSYKYLDFKYDKIALNDYGILGIRNDNKTLYGFKDNWYNAPADVQLDLSGEISVSTFLKFQY